MDEENGETEGTLKLAEESEQRRDLGGDIFVDSVKSDEGIENEKAWPQLIEGSLEPLSVECEIDSKGEGGDDLEVESGQINAGGVADSFEAAAKDVVRVFGGKDDDATGTLDGEAAQSRSAGGDCDGEIEREKRFAAFGFAADDSDGLVGPEIANEPAGVVRHAGEPVGGLEGEWIRCRHDGRIHALAPVVRRAPGLAGGVTSSK